MSKIIFELLAYLLFVFGWPYFLYRTLSGKENINSLLEKFGWYKVPKPSKGGIWIHAVSVGETINAAPLAEKILHDYPDAAITFSVSTATGMKLAQSKLKGKATIVFFPYDFPFSANLALSFINPALFIFMETELWPNFLRACKKRGVGTVLINGRISDKSFANYQKFKFLLAETLSGIDLALMQSEENARKIIELGAKPDSTKTPGNLKFDKSIPEGAEKDKKVLRGKFLLPEEPLVIVFASTHHGEDAIFLETFKNLKRQYSGIFPVIVPRHPERGKDIEKVCLEIGLKPARRSKGEPPEQLLILDTIGELAALYGAADIAVMGGSFIPHGGQNPLEPAMWKLPVIFGPHMENFREISALLIETGGAVGVLDKKMLEAELGKLLSSRERIESAGEALFNAVQKNRGALQRIYEEIESMPSFPYPRARK